MDVDYTKLRQIAHLFFLFAYVLFYIPRDKKIPSSDIVVEIILYFRDTNFRPINVWFAAAGSNECS